MYNPKFYMLPRITRYILLLPIQITYKLTSLPGRAFLRYVGLGLNSSVLYPRRLLTWKLDLFSSYPLQYDWNVSLVSWSFSYFIYSFKNY